VSDETRPTEDRLNRIAVDLRAMNRPGDVRAVSDPDMRQYVWWVSRRRNAYSINW